MKRVAYIIGVATTSFLLTISLSSQAKQYYGAELCQYQGFTCVKVKRNDSWRKMFPNKVHREIIKRLNRTNIPLHYRSWIVVPDNLNDISLMDLSPFPDQTDTSGKKTVVVDLKLQAFGAYDQSGHLIHWGPISGGKGYCPDVGRVCKTKAGAFHVINKQGPRCRSSAFPVETAGGAPMPYCMHFFRGFAMHGSTLPGFHASHGCVRLFTKDAKWLNKDFTDYSTRVIVKD